MKESNKTSIFAFKIFSIRARISGLVIPPFHCGIFGVKRNFCAGKNILDCGFSAAPVREKEFTTAEWKTKFGITISRFLHQKTND
jgi:hypothetical protein